MIGALLYLQYHSVVNSVTARVKRLKQPKYLVGGMVGALYMYFYFFRYAFGMGGRRHEAVLGGLPPDVRAMFETVGALILLVIVVVAWLVPHERAALTFSEAEVCFLFPAPVSRSMLIHFKLLRSQMRIFVSALFLTLVGRRMGGQVWIHAAGWWLILSTLNLHFLGSSFARTFLWEHGVGNWQRRAGILLLLAATLGGAVAWAAATLPSFRLSEIHSPQEALDCAKALLAVGPLPYLLFPFRFLVRPYLAMDAGAFLAALGPAMLLLALHYVWVIRSNVAFEEASVEASRKLAERVAALRSGHWQGGRKPAKGRRAPFALRSTGAPEVALLWKNLISAGQLVSPRLLLILLPMIVALWAVGGSVSSHSDIGTILGICAGGFAAWLVVLGPQVFRQDLRQDLPQMDILKAYPLKGWQLALGEVLAPALLLTVVQWVLLILGTGLLVQGHGLGRNPALVAVIGFGTLLVAPGLNLIQLAIPNAAVLLFPAWFQVGRDNPRGIEATGQRLVFLLGQLLALVVALIPAALGFVAIFFLVRALGGVLLAIPFAAAVAGAVLLVEAALAILLLGLLVERFDVSAEANA